MRGTFRNGTQGAAQPGFRSSASVAREMDLIGRIANEDRRAFEELYNLYRGRLARFLTRLNKRHDVAEEIINDTFWIVWRKARDFREDSQLSTWIFGIAYRRAKKVFPYSSRAVTEECLEASPPSLTSDEPMRTEELRDWLVRALAQLPIKQRVAVELCYELGYSCDEIGTIMGCPMSTVKTRLFHARAKLKKLLPALGGNVQPIGRPAPNRKRSRQSCEP